MAPQIGCICLGVVGFMMVLTSPPPIARTCRLPEYFDAEFRGAIVEVLFAPNKSFHGSDVTERVNQSMRMPQAGGSSSQRAGRRVTDDLTRQIRVRVGLARSMTGPSWAARKSLPTSERLAPE